MKNSTTPKFNPLSLLLILCIWIPVLLQAGDVKDNDVEDAKVMKCCHGMKAMWLKMRAEMKLQDAELTADVSKMNNATGDQKVSLMVAVITKMVNQRIARQTKRSKMEAEMMKHMIKHMNMRNMDPMKHRDGMKEMHDMVKKKNAPENKK